MKSLIEKLRHNLARAGLMEGAEPWVEINVGQDSVPRAAIRSVLFPAEANGLLRAAAHVTDLPPGSQIVFSADNDACEGKMYFVVTTDPPTLIDRAVNLLADVCPDVTEIRPGYAKCYVAESRTRLREADDAFDPKQFGLDSVHDVEINFKKLMPRGVLKHMKRREDKGYVEAGFEWKTGGALDKKVEGGAVFTCTYIFKDQEVYVHFLFEWHGTDIEKSTLIKVEDPETTTKNYPAEQAEAWMKKEMVPAAKKFEKVLKSEGIR